jgi:SAM-dependent methyltransferase
MSYNELIGLTRETNRPPGGITTLIRVAQATFLKPEESVLEIGTSTGFTAIEIARLTGAKVMAIDINPVSLKEASERAARFGVSNLTTFTEEDATALTFKDDSFDLVFCGNVTSLVNDRQKALAEYRRVLRPGKYLAAVPMYYIKKPSPGLVDRVSKAIQVNITPQFKQHWLGFFQVDRFELLLCEDYAFDEISPTRVDAFVDEIISRPHLARLSAEARETLADRYRSYVQLFRENNSHMGFSILLLRKEMCPMDGELFTATRL